MSTENKTPGIMIAAVKSGSGKTTLTCALLEALKNRGLNPGAFKCGPDYIDPMFHREVIGVSSHNLDGFFSGEEQLREIYTGNMAGKGIAVVEGVMGLFDGIGGICEEGSAYHVACALRLPVLLVVDAHGMGRSILPLLAGFLQYDKEKRIAGVILNRTSEHFYKSIAPVIEAELSLPVVGFLPKKQELALESRHLGLKLPEEIGNLKQQIALAAEILEESVSVDNIIELAMQGKKRDNQKEILLPHVKQCEQQTTCAKNRREEIGKGADREQECGRVRIGVAKDAAFCFYYEENISLLEQMGAEVVPFSPLRDGELPDGLGGIILGGGYPELYAKDLEKNDSMRSAIRQAIGNGMPSLAECGGFMYLHETLVDEKGSAYAMCGVLPGRCFYTGKLVRFGYIGLEEKCEHFLKNGTFVKGHEFHYYDSEDNGCDCTAKKPVTERRWDCVHGTGNHFWGFPHLYYPSNPGFAVHFIEEARLFQNKNKKGSGI